MQKQYVAPELKLAGKADEVVFGEGYGGGDLGGEMCFCLPPPCHDDDEDPEDRE